MDSSLSMVSSISFFELCYEKNLVENIEKFTLEDGRVVVLSRRVTSAPVKGPRILSQIFGNLGNADAGTLLGQ